MDEEEMDDEKNKENFVECHVCGDHIMKEFLDRHLKMNHENASEANRRKNKRKDVLKKQYKVQNPEDDIEELDQEDDLDTENETAQVAV